MTAFLHTRLLSATTPDTVIVGPNQPLFHARPQLDSSHRPRRDERRVQDQVACSTTERQKEQLLNVATLMTGGSVEEPDENHLNRTITQRRRMSTRGTRQMQTGVARCEKVQNFSGILSTLLRIF